MSEGDFLIPEGSNITIENLFNHTSEKDVIIENGSKKSSCPIWKEIMDKYNQERKELDEYLRKKNRTDEQRQKSSFNGIDFLSEYLYNVNPNYPERQKNWTYIFDLDWVQEYLEKSPRPFYPFSLIWTREYAALKIQSFMRGYFVRRRDDVQEIRTFWKEYKETKNKPESKE